MSVTSATRRQDDESRVIGDDFIVSFATALTAGAILIRWARGARNLPSRTTPLSSTAFSNGWTHPRDNGRSRRLIWYLPHWHMPGSTPGSTRSSGRRQTAIHPAVGGAHPC